MRVKCLAKEHNTMTRPGLEPGPLDPESSPLDHRVCYLVYKPKQLFYNEQRKELDLFVYNIIYLKTLRLPKSCLKRLLYYRIIHSLSTVAL